ncbi:hypothetical protein Tco_0341275 [Tanacetum coccineum]
MLFTIPFPAEHVLKLLGFSKDEEAIVEANSIQQIPHSLQGGVIMYDDMTYSMLVEMVVKKFKLDPNDRSTDGIPHYVMEGGPDTVEYLNAKGIMVAGCLGDMKNYYGKLETVVGVIKSCTPNALGDLTVTLKDLLGTMGGTMHYKVFKEEEGYAKSINVEAVLVLRNVSVFTPKPSNHYLNITLRNIVKVYHKDTVF